jgi:hypothetical protein
LGITLPNYFFLNGKLHKKLKVVKTENVVVAFCFFDETQMQYMYSVTCREFQKAYTMSEVAKLVKRPQTEIHKFLKNKLIDRPSGFAYAIRTKQPLNIYWSESEVLNLRDRLYELAPKGPDGFPRGRFTLVSKAELREAINGDVSYYVKNEEGEFKKVWRAL